MKIQKLKEFQVSILAVSFVLAISLMGCGPFHLIAPYDNQIDQEVTALQKDTETFLVKVNRLQKMDSRTYKDYTDFYDKEKVAISGLEIRAGVIAQNQRTLEQIAILKAQYEKLETRHKEHGLNTTDASEFSKVFNQTFTAILTLEIAKKQVSTSGSGASSQSDTSK